MINSMKTKKRCAHNQKCFHEPMHIRENVLEYLKTLRK